ncbi:MAG: hypothetical protein LBP55_10535 [Candidatus Adiutrix sp.]|jgi:hypothetical protein|nr:hypothetical protein [Candidatus Adiutrix sp.]
MKADQTDIIRNTGGLAEEILAVNLFAERVPKEQPLLSRQQINAIVKTRIIRIFQSSLFDFQQNMEIAEKYNMANAVNIYNP